MTAYEWFRSNGYNDIADMVDEVMAELKARESLQRRDWYLICAGGKNGKPKVVSGREFPVIRAFQVRQGLPATPNATWRSRNEVAPDIVKKGRWAGKPARRKVIKPKTTRRSS